MRVNGGHAKPATPPVLRLFPLLLLALAACAGAGPPRYTPRTEAPAAENVVQEADLAGQLLTPPPERSAEQTMRELPETILPLVGMQAALSPPLTPVELPPAPDTTAVLLAPVITGARREYQVQVAITPSSQEAELLVEQLRPLVPGEDVFVFFTRPYYRIRVGHKAGREEADQLLQRLAELGYTRALVIPVTVNPEQPPPLSGEAR
jgi:mRNA-degrading endonuclease toxin of MazEF toxin-antitoxin module